MIPTPGKTYKVSHVDTPVTILSPMGRDGDKMWLGVYRRDNEVFVTHCYESTVLTEATAVAVLDVHLVPGTEPGVYRAVTVAAGQAVADSVGYTQCQVVVFPPEVQEAPNAVRKRRASKSARSVRGAT